MLNQEIDSRAIRAYVFLPILVGLLSQLTKSYFIFIVSLVRWQYRYCVSLRHHHVNLLFVFDIPFFNFRSILLYHLLLFDFGCYRHLPAYFILTKAYLHRFINGESEHNEKNNHENNSDGRLWKNQVEQHTEARTEGQRGDDYDGVVILDEGPAFFSLDCTSPFKVNDITEECAEYYCEVRNKYALACLETKEYHD